MLRPNSPLSFGHWLKQRRRALDLTQEELALRIHCSLETIRKIEADTRRPSKEMAQLLAQELVPEASRQEFLAFARAANTRVETPVLTPPIVVRAPSLLPVFPNQLIGRDLELASVRERVVSDDVRLLMLLGPPGVGKTRLAVELAATLASEFSDGVYFVDLAVITSAARVPNAIAQTLGVRETAAQGTQERVCTYLRDKQLLLVLDNLEQVTEAGDFIALLMASAARLKLLGTSRIPLFIRGEWQFPLVPLAVPAADSVSDLASLAEYPSVQLFVERARAAQPDFRMTAGNAQAIASLCARVDGLPLAIELIAARNRFLAPQTLLERLDAPFLLDTDGMRDLPPRQRTLRNAIRWSHELLDAPEKLLLAQLGVFVGGASVIAVNAICRPAVASGSKNKRRAKESQVALLLQSLVDKSLVRRLPDAEPARVTLLETIREFARERLLEDGALYKRVRQSHAEFFLAMAQNAEPHVRGAPDQIVWLNQLEQEHENLRAALRWFGETGQWVKGLQLGGMLWRFWLLRGYWSEGRQELSDLTDRVLNARPDFWNDGIEREPELAAALGTVLTGAGTLATRQNEYIRAREVLEQAVLLWRRAEQTISSLRDRRETRLGLAYALGELGFNLQRQEIFQAAETCYLESWEMCLALDDGWGQGFASANLGRVSIQQADLDRARKWFSRALEIWRSQGNEEGIAGMLNNLGEVARGQGELKEAYAYYSESLAFARHLGANSRIATVLNNLGRVARRQGEYAAATRLLREGLAVNLELGNRAGISAGLLTLGGVCIDRGAFADGVKLFGALDALRAVTGVRMEYVDRIEYERDLESARATLDPLAFELAWTEGRVWAPEEAVAFAHGGW